MRALDAFSVNLPSVMKIISNREKGITIGIDLGDKKLAVCVLDYEGED